MKNTERLQTIQLLLLATTIFFSTKSCLGKFVVKRNKNTSDKLIALDHQKVNKDSSAFKKDGTCFDTNEHIASDYGSKTIKCYTTTRLNGLGNGKFTE